MNGYVETTFGVLKILPDVIQAGKDIWKHLKPPEQILATHTQDGISENTYYSADYKFAISVPDQNQWEFWRPSPQFLSSLGSMFAVPSRAMPIVILSHQVIKLFRPSVNITVEKVGQYTNIDEMVQMSVLTIRQAGFNIEDTDVYIDNAKQAAVVGSSQPYLPGSTLCQAQQCYLRGGIFYTVTASYVPMSDVSKELFGGLQEIMGSFNLLKF
jgi:hypothetical protein